MKKIIKNNIIGFIISCMLFGVVTVVVASQTLSSSSVEYKDNKSVETALNELYSKKNQLYKKYKVGDKVTIKNEDYYVIADSSQSQNYVTLLKDVPLTVTDINTYGAGHVNMYTKSTVDYYQTAYDFNDENHSGGMAFYMSSTCHSDLGDGNDVVTSGCTNDYDSSEVKYAVDGWAKNKFKNQELKKVDGYKARLASWSDLLSKFYPSCSSSSLCNKVSDTPNWLWNSNYNFWIIKPNITTSAGYVIANNGSMSGNGGVYSINVAVRPVINIYKVKM